MPLRALWAPLPPALPGLVLRVLPPVSLPVTAAGRRARYRAAHPHVEAEASARWRAAHPGAAAAATAKYRAAHIEECRAYDRLRMAKKRHGGRLPGGYRGELPEFAGAPYASDRAARVLGGVANRRTYRANKREADACYRARHRAELNEKLKAWQRANPEKLAAQRARARAARKARDASA